MRIVVITAFFGVPDGRVYPRDILPGEELTGDLAQLALREGWAEEQEGVAEAEAARIAGEAEAEAARVAAEAEAARIAAEAEAARIAAEAEAAGAAVQAEGDPKAKRR